MRIAVCWKWVVAAAGDAAQGSVSAADQAALEVALRRADASSDSTVTVVSYGDATADAGLRTALSAGADRVVRIDGDPHTRSVDVAEALASSVADDDLVICGDHSLDRGTGSVPGFLAAMLGRPQALGLIELTAPTGGGTEWSAVRRLDGGRREVLRITPPAVASVEAPVATLRRASLPALRAAASAPVTVVAAPATTQDAPPTVTAFRPRPRVVAAPPGDEALHRIQALLGTGDDARRAGDAVTADPPDAAAMILRRLREWGYLTGDTAPQQ